MRHPTNSFPAALLCLFAVLFPAVASAAMNCNPSIDPRGEILWRQVKAGSKQLNFLAPTSPDRPDCPGGEGCNLPAFLVGGDQVIVTGRGYETVYKKDLICAVYISPKGVMTYGWIDNAGLYGGGNVMSAIDDAKVYGDWSKPEAASGVTIREGEQGSHILIAGHIGIDPRAEEIGGPAFISNEGNAAGYTMSHYDGALPPSDLPRLDKDDCRIRFRYTGYYLVVDDNDKCSTRGLTFTGVYVKSK